MDWELFLERALLTIMGFGMSPGKAAHRDESNRLLFLTDLSMLKRDETGNSFTASHGIRKTAICRMEIPNTGEGPTTHFLY